MSRLDDRYVISGFVRRSGFVRQLVFSELMASLCRALLGGNAFLYSELRDSSAIEGYAPGPRKRPQISAICTCYRRTEFSTAVYVRQGSCRNGTELACDFNACRTTGSAQGSRLEFPVVTGQTYFIVVDGVAGQAGMFRLRVFPP